MAVSRIVYLVPDLVGPPGGIARYCRHVCLALSRAGMALSLIALNDDVAPVHTTPCAIKYHACGKNRRSFVWRALKSVMTRPEIVLVGHANFAALGWVIARLARAELVVFLYGKEAWDPLPFTRRTALRRYDSWIAISRFTARKAASSFNLPEDEILTLHNCLDPNLEPRPMNNALEVFPSLLTVARLSKVDAYKGHHQVIEAMPALLARFPSLVYHVVGDGDAREELQILVRQRGLADSVRFHGLVSDEELVRLYSTAAVFIMPSRHEGFGFVFIEAMAQGTPAIGGSEDAAYEAISHGRTGYLVDPSSVDEIIDAATLLLSDDNLRHAMGEEARKDVRMRFSFPSFQDKLVSYLHLADGCPPKLDSRI